MVFLFAKFVKYMCHNLSLLFDAKLPVKKILKDSVPYILRLIGHRHRVAHNFTIVHFIGDYLLQQNNIMLFNKPQICF